MEVDGPTVKVCGLRREEDALLALELGASYLGIILTRKSARHMPPEKASELLETVRKQHPEARWVGVFVDEPPERIAQLTRDLDLSAVQIHSNPGQCLRFLPPEKIIPAMSMRDEFDAEKAAALDPAHYAVLVDAFVPGMHGGTGKRFEHRWVQPLFSRRRIFVAGGLAPDNIGEVVRRLAPGPYPHAFDLSSGLEESPGVKSHKLMREFFGNLKKALAA